MMSSPQYSPNSMSDLLQLLSPGSRVLDLGCGNGSFPYGSFPDLAIDALDEFIPPPPGHFPPQVRYHQGRAEDLPYDDGSFAMVIANFVLEHVSDFPVAIEQIARVLEAGGYFYMAVPNARSFEDALYRGIYEGGGHLQRHSFESVLATVYSRTQMKLLSYVEWPAGFTFLQDREGLRALAARVIAACQESLGVDIRARSNYIFVFQQGQGLGLRPVEAVCSYCGAGMTHPVDNRSDWTCPVCGRRNDASSNVAVSDEQLDEDMRTLWERHPHLKP